MAPELLAKGRYMNQIAKPITSEEPVVGAKVQTANQSALPEKVAPSEFHALLQTLRDLSDSVVREKEDKTEYTPKPKTGEKAEWSWTQAQGGEQSISQLPQFRLGAKALGLSPEAAYAQGNEVADIVKIAIDELQNSDPEAVYRYLAYFMQTCPASSLSGIKRELIETIKGEEVQ